MLNKMQTMRDSSPSHYLIDMHSIKNLTLHGVSITGQPICHVNITHPTTPAHVQS